MSFMGNWIGNQALAAHSRKETEKALKLYREAWEKGMDQAKLLRGYAVLLIRTEQFETAWEVLDKLEAAKNLAEADKADIQANRAVIVWKRGDVGKALEMLEEVFKKIKNGTLYSMIGYLLIEKGDFAEAERFNLDSLEYDDEDPVFLDNVGQTYYRLAGDKEKAKPYFEKAISFKPTAIDTNYFLARYDIDEGHYASARKHLETSAKGFFSPLNYVTREMVKEKLAELEGKEDGK